MKLEDAIKQGIVSQYDTEQGKLYYAHKAIDITYDLESDQQINFAYNRAFTEEVFDPPITVKTENGQYTAYQRYWLQNDPEMLRVLSIPKSTKKIQDFSCFCSYYLTNTDTFKQLTDLRNIGRCAFAYCFALGQYQSVHSDNLFLPESLETISYGAFMSCILLKTVYIPKSVTTICKNAFAGNSSLKYLVFLDRTESEIRAMANFGEWTEKSYNVKYVPGKVGGKKNPVIDNLPEDNSSIGFSVTKFSLAKAKIDASLLTHNFFESYRTPILGANRMFGASDEPYPPCTSYSKDICGPDKNKPCTNPQKDDADCLLHSDEPTPTPPPPPPCTQPDYPCDSPMMKDWGKPSPPPQDPPGPLDPPSNPITNPPIDPIELPSPVGGGSGIGVGVGDPGIFVGGGGLGPQGEGDRGVFIVIGGRKSF